MGTSAMTTSDLLVVALLFALAQGVVLYLIIKAAFVRGFRSALELLAGQSRQKGVAKSVRDDFRAVVKWVKTIDVVPDHVEKS
jgi:hypothetical protein